MKGLVSTCRLSPRLRGDRTQRSGPRGVHGARAKASARGHRITPLAASRRSPRKRGDRAVVLTTALLVAACTSTPDTPEPDAAPFPYQTDTPATASLWNQDPQSLFGNRRAREVGDILTLIVEIDEQAEIGNQVQRSRQTERSFGVGALFGLPQWASGRLPGGAGIEDSIDLGGGSQASGGGTLRREDRVTLRLAARVTERLPNGDLVVEGRQSVRVNYEERLLRASGIVRPEDISRANTVTHDKMAEAEIGYVGRGALDRAVRPRLGERVLDILTPF